MSKRLIVNADDYGRTARVVEGILRAHQQVIVTSTTAMMNMPGIEDALRRTQCCPEMGLGVHLVSSAWRPLLLPEQIPSLVDTDGAFLSQKAIWARPEAIQRDELRAELTAQVERFQALTGHPPDHLDCHHFVHSHPLFFTVYVELAVQWSLPIRAPFPPEETLSRAAATVPLIEGFPLYKVRDMMRQDRDLVQANGVRHPDHFVGSFYGKEAVTLENLLAILEGLREGTTELMCHPGLADEQLLAESIYGRPREKELELLCHPRVRGKIDELGIELVNFGVLGRGEGKGCPAGCCVLASATFPTDFICQPSAWPRLAAMTDSKVFIRDQLIIDPEAGSLTVVYRAVPLLSGATAAVSYRSGGRKMYLSILGRDMAYGVGLRQQEEVSLSRANDELRLDWHIALGDEVEMWLEVTNVGQTPLQVDELHVLAIDAAQGGKVELGLPPRRWSFYQNGWQSWSPAVARHVDGGLYVDPNTEDYQTKHQPHYRPGQGDAFSSEWFTVLRGRGTGAKERCLLLGFITTKEQLAEVRLPLDSEECERLVAICHADGVTLKPGERLFSERLVIVPGEDPFGLLKDYAQRLGQVMKAQQRTLPPTGWCSWYYFFRGVTSADVLDNVAAIEKEALPLEYIVVDDGYQTAIGDWLSVDEGKFADMRGLAEAVVRAGYKPGIWTAPFGASPDSQLYAEHPDWVIRDEDGQPLVAWQHWGVDTYGLDLSHSEVQEWLRETFRTMRHEWGYELFKVDFIFAGGLAGRRHNPQMTRAQAMRKGLDIIRQVIGEDAFLLGCGAPLGPSIGLVDAMRIGPDVAVHWHPFWGDLSFPAAENALRNVVTRYFMHGALWLNDPDCLLVRTRDDESNLVLNEMRTMASIIGLCGGMVLSSDNLASIRRGRLKYLKQVLPPFGRAAIPLDLFEREMPGLLALPVETDWGQWLVVGLVNWADRTTETTIDLADLELPKGCYHVYNYWRRRYLGTVEDHLTIKRHQPHETVLLLVKPVSDRPELLTSTFHVTQGGVEVSGIGWHGTWEKGRTLVVELEKAGRQRGELLFAVPEPYRVKEVRLNGRRRGVKRVARGVISLGFSLRDRARVELDFER